MKHYDYAVTESVDVDRIVVAVYHRPIASYSRSVLPRAKRHVRGIIHGGSTWALTDVDYDRPSVIGNAVTVVTFERVQS